MKRLAYKSKKGLNFIDFDRIVFIEKMDRKIIIHTEEERFTTNGTLTSIYDKLDKDIFFRSHRSYIINVEKVNKIYPWGEKSYRVIFNNTKKDAFFSYDKYKEFRDSYIGN